MHQCKSPWKIVYFSHPPPFDFSVCSVLFLSAGDLRTVIRAKHPRLQMHAPRIIATFQLLASNADLMTALNALSAADAALAAASATPAAAASSPYHQSVGASVSSSSSPASASSAPVSAHASQRLSLGSRKLTTRDLFKWCARIDARFAALGAALGADGTTIEESIFIEALDCFASAVPSGMLARGYKGCAGIRVGEGRVDGWGKGGMRWKGGRVGGRDLGRSKSRDEYSCKSS